MPIQIPQGFGQNDFNPGLNTMAQSNQKTTETLGPALMARQSQMAIAKGYQDIGKAQLASTEAMRQATFQQGVSQHAADIFAKSGGMERAQQIAAAKFAGIQPTDSPLQQRFKLLQYQNFTPDPIKQQHIQQTVMGMLQEAGQQATQLMGQGAAYQGANPPGLSAPQAAPQQLGTNLSGMSGLSLPGVSQALAGPMGYTGNPLNLIK